MVDLETQRLEQTALIASLGSNLMSFTEDSRKTLQNVARHDMTMSGFVMVVVYSRILPSQKFR